MVPENSVSLPSKPTFKVAAAPLLKTIPLPAREPMVVPRPPRSNRDVAELSVKAE